MNDTSPLQKIVTETFEENLKNAVKKKISTRKNDLMNFMNETYSSWEEIVNTSYWWKVIENKSSQYDVLFKENEKFLYDLMYVDGEIQYTNKQIEIDKDHANEIETLIKETVVKLKECEHERDETQIKVVNKHNAFKRASKYYKSRLNLYVRIVKENDKLQANICYFTQKFDETYSFVISKNDNNDNWTLNSVKPQLEDFQFMALQKRFYSSNNISSLLCTVRKILIMYQNSRK